MISHQLSFDDAIAQVRQNARSEWGAKALVVVKQLCKEHASFTTDMVWAELDKTGWKSHEPRALGAIMRQASSNDWCRSTGQFTISQRPACHRRPITIWQSLLISANPS